MIKIVKGDLLLAKEDIIAHQVNCMGKMNSGVAKQIRNKYPEVFAYYEQYVNRHLEIFNNRSLMLGGVQTIPVHDGKLVANLFGQLQYGYDGVKYTNEEKLFSCFRVLRKNAEREGLSVALPYMIGCYRGGADWEIVENYLLTAFNGYEVTLYKKHEG